MLHILLLLLRIILIIVGVLAALIVLMLLLILFCPFRYSLSGSTSPGLEGKVKLSWLFHGITLTLGYHDRKSDFQIRIFGVRSQRYLNLFKRLRGLFSRGRRRTGPKPPPASGDVRQPQQPGQPEQPTQEPPTAKLPEPEEEQPQPEEEQPKTEEGQPKTGQPSRFRKFFQRVGSFLQGLARRIRGVFGWFAKWPGRIAHLFQSISHTLHNMQSFIDRWRRFFEDEKVQAGIASAWQTLKKLFSHVRPRKIKGKIRFGFSNPATTGEVLAVIGATCPIHKNVLTVIPDFENQVFEGDLLIKGRVYLFAVLYQALHLYLDKNFKYLMRQARQKEG